MVKPVLMVEKTRLSPEVESMSRLVTLSAVCRTSGNLAAALFQSISLLSPIRCALLVQIDFKKYSGNLLECYRHRDKSRDNADA
jgi:hypothetical protein